MWIRARSEEQKETRIAEILAAAARLIDECDYDDINLASIAREARFTRSNLYKYFTAKEEIFIELIKQDFSRWAEDIENAARQETEITVESFASLWVAAFLKHGRLAKLIPILFTSLEKNATIEHLVGFKLLMKEQMERLTVLICGLFPRMTPEKTARFLYLQTALAIGLYPMANATEKQREAMRRSGMEHNHVDFTREYALSLRYILVGLMEE